MSKTQLRRIDMNLLMIFASVIRHQKLTLAAEELGLTKSAISHALVRLRDIFGDELFVRRQTGVQVTPKAFTLAPKIASILELAADALMIDHSFDPLNDRRNLRLGTMEVGALLFGPPLTEIMQREAPNMHLSIVTMRRGELLDQVARQNLDLGLSMFFGGAGNIPIEPLYNDHFVVVTRRNHPAIRGKLDRNTYLKAEHLLVMGEGHPPVILESSFSSLGISRKVVQTMPLYMPALAAVARSDRFLTIPLRLAHYYAQPFCLDIHPFPFPRVQVAVSLISHPSAGHDPGVLWFTSKMHEVAASLCNETGGE
jgi:DNA-binding transcriptional LysR family regulator